MKQFLQMQHCNKWQIINNFEILPKVIDLAKQKLYRLAKTLQNNILLIAVIIKENKSIFMINLILQIQ